MKTFKQLMALLLVFVLVAACVPLGSITAFAAENDETDISAVDTEIDAEPECTPKNGHGNLIHKSDLSSIEYFKRFHTFLKFFDFFGYKKRKTRIRPPRPWL